jgi:hypothetical protein
MKTDAATPLPECIEGPEAFRRFDEGIRQILSVSHSTLVRRERAYRKKVEANPNRRGPKRKIKPSASHGPAA